MKKFYIILYYIILYYAFARHLPQQPLPGYKLGNRLRSWICSKLFKKQGKTLP